MHQIVRICNCNRRVVEELGDDFQIGHSYFMDPVVGTEAGLRLIWQRAIMPLLEEYFYNDRNRRQMMQDLAIDQLLATLSQAAPSEE